MEKKEETTRKMKEGLDILYSLYRYYITTGTS